MAPLGASATRRGAARMHGGAACVLLRKCGNSHTRYTRRARRAAPSRHVTLLLPIKLPEPGYLEHALADGWMQGCLALVVGCSRADGCQDASSGTSWCRGTAKATAKYTDFTKSLREILRAVYLKQAAHPGIFRCLRKKYTEYTEYTGNFLRYIHANITYSRV